MAHDEEFRRATWFLESSGDAGIITTIDGTIEYVNPAFEAMTGYGAKEAVGHTPRILKSGQQPGEFYRSLWAALHAGREYRGVLVNRRRDGNLYHEEKTIRPLFDAGGAICHFMSVGRDVSSRVAALEKLRYDATHDGLTELPNRTLFHDRLERSLTQAARGGERLAVALIDISGFKAINDGYGHEAGDAALRATAQRLRRCVRQTDTAARLGGDEFALLLHDSNDVERVMGALMQACAQPFHWESLQIPLSISVGVSCYPDDDRSAAALLRRADEAMYRAKAAGGGRSSWAMSQPSPTATVVADPGVGELDMLERDLPLLRRVLRPGDSIYRVGERFRDVHILNVGLCKLYSLSPEGREELITMMFRGDWLGFDGLADGRHRYGAVAADVCELLTVRYDALLRASAKNPALLGLMHTALARQNVRERDGVMSMHNLPADGRVAAFLCRWADELEARGLRSDQILLPTTRAEIGGHVGLTLESVSRAMTHLESERLISFGPRNRRDVGIPSLPALRSFVNGLASASR